MGEAAMKVSGLLPQISSLFNNRLYSDVVFLFAHDGETTKKIYAHKLILALRSEAFASMFYESTESLSKVKLPASKLSPFFELLRFLYTDDVQIHTFEEAKELFELANEYATEELKEKCANYMQQEPLTVENVIPLYEYAIVQNMQLPLKVCQDFVCSNAEMVLESIHFANASLKVVEDIVKLDSLSVATEMTVIIAVLSWGTQELKRKEMSKDEKYLRECIEPLLKHLRFLTLSFSEFDSFIENFNIFTGYESSILTRKIYQPQRDVDFPESLCPLIIKRGKKLVSKATSPKATEQKTLSFPEIQPGFATERLSPIEVKNSPFHSSNHKISRSISHSSTGALCSKKEVSDAHESPSTSSNKISYEPKRHPPSTRANVSESVKKVSNQPMAISYNKPTKFFSSPNLMDGYLLRTNYKSFYFPLQESQSCLGTSFPKDVKSSLSFKMSSGNILLYGFELKVKNANKKSEEFEIDVDLKGFSKPFSKVFTKELSGDIISYKFPETMRLQEGSKGVLEVSIDNLVLNRCCMCSIGEKKTINCGLGFECELSLSSTQKLQDLPNSCIFLISKLTYMPC